MEPANEPGSVTIGNVTIGGKPKGNPTCMIGTMFYRGHSVVKDKKKGIIDEDIARQEVQQLEQAAEDTGLPFILDVVGTSAENLVKYCIFVADSTENKKQPFLMDGLSDEIRLPALEQLVDAGLRDRLIYNSIEPKISEKTLEKIKEQGVKNAVVLAFDSRLLLPKHKIKILFGKDQGEGDKESEEEGLISKARRAGVENILVDVAVLDMPSMGIAARTMKELKKIENFPTGCAPSNAVFECVGLRERGKEARMNSLIGACTFLAAEGADFLLFGPVKHAGRVFLPVAQVDAYMAYTARRVDKVKMDLKNHPLSKVF